MRRALALSILLAAALAGDAVAVEPPTDCGRMTVKGKRYQVKADQIRCTTGRRYSRRYLERRARPRGYRCRDFPSRRGRVDVYCFNGRRVFFAIRR